MTHPELRAQIAFRLTGLKAENAAASSCRQLRPALTARHRNLTNLRFDFPLVLPVEPAGSEYAVALSTLVDRLLDKIAPLDGDNLRLRHAVLKLEREIRVALAYGASGSLRALWDLAASRLCAHGDDAIAGDLARALRALEVDGEVVDCDASFPARLVLQAWKTVQKQKTARFRDELDRLIVGLGDILAADEARCPQSRSAERLRKAMGSLHREAFDFDAMSRLVGRGGSWRPLTEARRRRIRSLLVALESQRFFMDDSGYTFVFDRCAPALRTFRARYPRLRSLARSMAMARLEVEGAYEEEEHDALFRQIKESPVSRDELAKFPDYLVCLRESGADASAREELLELLSSGIPAKVLLQTDDLLEEMAAAEGLAPVAAKADAVAGLAIGLNDVFVLQASASHLPKMGARVLEGLAYPGTALFSVFSGAAGDTAVLPPYLNAAAAMESRAFPAFVYDPSIALEAGTRFSVEGNPQVESDWPVHAFEFEDSQHQRANRELPFTVADFIASDERFSAHFMPVSGEAGNFVPVPAWLDARMGAQDEASPAIAMVDDRDRMYEVIVDETVVGVTRRCRDRWQRLQRWAAAAQPAVAEAPPPAAETAAPVAPETAPPAAAPVQASPSPSSDEAYIETPRCTSCDECTQLNNRMFAYDGNKQAYIKDLAAGTYRQLVEAAENCQVSIIHPGKPRDPNEQGIAELLERAAAFS